MYKEMIEKNKEANFMMNYLFSKLPITPSIKYTEFKGIRSLEDQMEIQGLSKFARILSNTLDLIKRDKNVVRERVDTYNFLQRTELFILQDNFSNFNLLIDLLCFYSNLKIKNKVIRYWIHGLAKFDKESPDNRSVLLELEASLLEITELMRKSNLNSSSRFSFDLTEKLARLWNLLISSPFSSPFHSSPSSLSPSSSPSPSQRSSTHSPAILNNKLQNQLLFSSFPPSPFNPLSPSVSPSSLTPLRTPISKSSSASSERDLYVPTTPLRMFFLYFLIFFLLSLPLLSPFSSLSPFSPLPLLSSLPFSPPSLSFLLPFLSSLLLSLLSPPPPLSSLLRSEEHTSQLQSQSNLIF